MPPIGKTFVAIQQSEILNLEIVARHIEPADDFAGAANQCGIPAPRVRDGKQPTTQPRGSQWFQLCVDGIGHAIATSSHERAIKEETQSLSRRPKALPRVRLDILVREQSNGHRSQL